nr:porin [uncultured Succinatimonas sp.]
MRTQLTDNIAGFAFIEWDAADSDKKQNFEARDVYVGADFGVFGQLQAGRFRDAVYQGVTSTTDVFDDWGCDGQLGNDDRREGQIMYSWSGYGVDFKANYETAKDNVNMDGAWYENESVDVKNGFAVSLGYTSPDVLFGPIAVKAGYGYYRMNDDKGSASNSVYDNYSQWAAALSWGTKAAGPLVAVTYQARDFSVNADAVTKVWHNGTKMDDYTVSGVEAIVGYGFDNGVAIRAGWEWMNIDQDGANGADIDAYTIPVYVNYQINPNFNVWAEARFDAGTDDGKDSFDNWTHKTNFEENVYSVGARYTF